MNYNEKFMEAVKMFKEHSDEINTDVNFHFVAIDKNDNGTGITQCSSSLSDEESIAMLMYHIEAVRRLMEIGHSYPVDKNCKTDTDKRIDWMATISTIYLLSAEEGHLDFGDGYKASCISVPRKFKK